MNDESATSAQSVEEYLASLEDERTLADSRVLIAMMQRITECSPNLANVGTIGFDSYHFRYESGREGDCQVLGFYPRKAKLTIYLMDGTARHADLLSQLGKHTTSRVCLYIKRLEDIAMPVLEQILRESYAYLKAPDGHMHRVME